MSLAHLPSSLTGATTGAAAYRVGDASRGALMLRGMTVLLGAQVILWLFSDAWRDAGFAYILLGLSLPLGAWLALRFILVRRVMRTPEPERIVLFDPRWEALRFHGWGGDVLTAYHLQSESKDGGKDLVLYCHGYGSSLPSGETRMLHLETLGMDVLGMNMRGHGACTRRDDWTLLKAAADLEALLDEAQDLYDELPERVWLYGHSVGGFLALRLGAHPSGWWSERLAGVILESPATSFPLVIENIVSTRLRPLMPWIRHILRREYERIHPDLDVRYATAQVPHIGLPEAPTLVLQAAEDTQLGRVHYDLLMAHANIAITESHLLEDHLHTSKQDTDSRRDRLEKWLGRHRENTPGWRPAA